MNKFFPPMIAGVVFLLQTASAQQTVLFTTTNDFTGWSGGSQLTASPTTVTDLDNVTINGLANTTAAGSAGTPGALGVNWVSGSFDYVFSQGEAGNAAFISAIEGATNTVRLTFSYTTPSPGSGSYYQLGLAFNFTGNFFNISPSSATTVNGVTTATFDITAAAQALYNQDPDHDGGGIGYLQVGFYYNSNYTPSDAFYVDAISLTNTVPPPPPAPPVMSIQNASPGLNLITSVPGNGGQRQNIETVNSYPWLGDPGVTRYSLTITNFPGTNYNGFQAQVFLVTGPTGTESAADFNETNVLFLQIVNNAAGGATALLTYKTNAPNSFPYFSSGILASMQSPLVTGTWTLAFQNDTNITLTTPANTTTNVVISPDIANQFAGPLFAYFGIQPNNTNNVGQSVIFSRVQITNSTSLLDEQFTTAPLDSSVWQVPALDPNGVIVAPPGSVFWLAWTLPASGFNLQASSSLTVPDWADPGLVTYPCQDKTRALVSTGSLPSPGQGYYRLSNP
jgi:hypothetical protein